MDHYKNPRNRGLIANGSFAMEQRNSSCGDEITCTGLIEEGILTTALFEEIMRSGRPYHSPFLSLRLCELRDKESSRFSISVPKKVESRATRRNLIRRRIAAALRKYISIIPDGYMGIFFAKKGLLDRSYHEVEEEVGLLIKRLV